MIDQLLANDCLLGWAITLNVLLTIVMAGRCMYVIHKFAKLDNKIHRGLIDRVAALERGEIA